MKKTTILLLTILFFSIGCTDIDDKLNVQIRVHNSTEVILTKVSVDLLEYDDIAAGAKTAYKAKEDFLAVKQLTVESDSLVIPLTINNIQQDTLQPGRYTYKINIFSEADGIEFEVIED